MKTQILLYLLLFAAFSCAGKNKEESTKEAGGKRTAEENMADAQSKTDIKPIITREGMKAVKQVRERLLDPEKKPLGDLHKLSLSQSGGVKEVDGVQKYAFVTPEIPKITKREWPAFSGKKIAIIHTSNVMGELEPSG